MHAWLGIELRHLAALQAVAEERSFVRAARRLGYTQSAISNQIAALERLVCARLVERVRGGSSISLTEAGRLLYDHAVVLIARLQAARTDVAAAGQESTAVLRVGYFQSVGATVLPRVVEAFRERALGVRVELELGFADGSLQERVAAGELDAAFVSTPIRADGIVSSHLFDDPFVLLAPPEAARPLAPDFHNLPLLAYRPCPAQLEHERALGSAHGLTRGAVVSIEDAATIQALVAAGCAYGLLPSLAVTRSDLTVETLDGPRRQVDLVWQRDRAGTESLRQFIACAERESFSLDGRTGATVTRFSRSAA